MITNREPTDVTPRISYDSSSGTLLIHGDSYPENVTQFYGPVFEEIRSALSKTERFTVQFMLNYFNTSSAKYIFDILALLEDAQAHGKAVSVVWYYPGNVEIMREHGEDFADEFDLPFELEPIAES